MRGRIGAAFLRDRRIRGWLGEPGRSDCGARKRSDLASGESWSSGSISGRADARTRGHREPSAAGSFAIGASVLVVLIATASWASRQLLIPRWRWVPLAPGQRQRTSCGVRHSANSGA